MLSPKLLTALRTLWRYYHRKSSTWLFPSNYRKDRPIDTKTVWRACQKAHGICGIPKPITPHSLRHYAESRTIAELLGDISFKTALDKGFGEMSHEHNSR